MIVWFALLIPAAAAVFMLIKYQKEVVWWEILLMMIVCALLILGGKLLGEKMQLNEPEYWGSFVVAGYYEEPWTEYYHETCTRTYACGHDSKGNTEYCTETYDCSHHVHHDAEYYVKTNIGERIGVTREYYNWLSGTKFGNSHFVALHREEHYDIGKHSWFHCSECYNGDMYETDYPGEFGRLEPIVSEHTYTNRVIHSGSVFNFPKVADTLNYLFPKLPKLEGLHAVAVRGIQVPNWEIADDLLQKYNGYIGHEKEVRMQMILYHNQPIDVGEQLEWYWKGGNMNEFNVVVSLSDSLTVQWVRVISWTEVQELKIEVRNYIATMKPFDPAKAALFMAQDCDQKWKRRDFEQFNYLEVETPTWAIIMIYILTLASTIGLSIWSVENEFGNGYREMDSFDRRFSKRRGY